MFTLKKLGPLASQTLARLKQEGRTGVRGRECGRYAVQPRLTVAPNALTRSKLLPICR